MRGWLAEIKRRDDALLQIIPYDRLGKLVAFWSLCRILPFDGVAAIGFRALRGQVRIGTQDLARLFDTYLNEVAQKCADATIENWKVRLAGVDVWTNRHCQQIINALRVD